MTVITINQQWIDENPNPKSSLSASLWTADYQGRTAGIVQTLLAAETSTSLLQEMKVATKLGVSDALTQVGEGFGEVNAALNLAGLFSSARDAKKALFALVEEDGKDFHIKLIQAVRDLADAVSTYVYSALFIFRDLSVGNIARFTDLCYVIADLQIHVHSYAESSKLEAISQGNVKDVFAHSKHYYLLSLVKNVISLATAILGTVLLTMGPSQVVTIATLISSLWTTALSVYKELYKDQKNFPVIDFDCHVIAGI